MNILIFAGQSSKKLASKLEPLQANKSVDQIYLVRNSFFSGEKITCITPVLQFPVLRELSKLFKAIKLIRSTHIHYIIGFYLIPHGIMASVLGFIFNIRVIQISLGEDAYILKKHSLWLSIFYKNSYAVGVRGHTTRELIKSIIGNNQHWFIPHNVFISANNINPYLKTVKYNSFTCLTVSNFSNAKNIPLFLKVISIVKHTDPDIKFVMVGGSSMPQRIKHEIDQLQIGDVLEHIPYCDDLNTYYKSSHAFLLTSEVEGLPMAIIEAMSFGLPVISSSTGDIPDIIQNMKNGILFHPTSSPSLFANSIIQIKNNPELRGSLSNSAFTSIQLLSDEFSPDHIKKAWQNIIREI